MKSTQQCKTQSISFFQMFRFANSESKLYILVGTLAAIVNGITQPLFYYVQGTMYGAFTQQNKQSRDIYKKVIQLLVLAIVYFFSSWMMYVCWIIAGQKQTIICKKAYLNSMFSQEIGWFDLKNQNQLASMFQKSTVSFNQAIGQKIPILISIFSVIITQFSIAIIQGWQLGLVGLTCLPIFYVTMLLNGKFRRLKNQITLKSYQEVDGKAAEVISCIKTVKSMNGEDHELKGYSYILDKVHHNIINFSILSAIAISSSGFSNYLSNALTYWYGSELIINKTLVNGHPYTPTVIFGIISVVYSINQGIPYMEQSIKKILQGRAYATNMFKIIDKVPLINNNEDGITLSDSGLKGIIKFQNVKFAYPKQPNKLILNNISFEILSNQSVAFVGESGCGKSTISQLITRFYDPLEGRITLDGIDLHKFNLHWLRSKIGYVSQQPILFATTIKQNLLMANPTATQQQLIKALKLANAYDFTMDLQDKLDTYVGESGAQLSGGQKQRIAIAREILKKCKIIIFDQATSALDTNNEIMIQQTLQNISQMTTINIAHRINTIKNTEMIFVIDQGRVIEKGKFNQLQKFKNINYIEHSKQKYLQQNTEVTKLQVETQNSDNQIKSDQAEQNSDSQLTQDLDEDKKYENGFYERLFTYNKKDIKLLIFGILFAFVHGLVYIFGKIYNGYVINAIIANYESPSSQKISHIRFLCIMFTVIAICFFIFNSVKIGIFWVMSQNLTLQLKINSFIKLIKMPVWWYDIPKNQHLQNRLPVSFNRLSQVTADFIHLIVVVLTSIIFTLSLSFYYDWKLTFISIAIVPFMMITSLFQNSLLTIINKNIAKFQRNNLISQGLTNIRTLYSMNGQATLLKNCNQDFKDRYQEAIKRAHIIGIFNGISTSALYIATGILFYISIILVKQNIISVLASIMVRNNIISCAFSVGGMMKQLPDFIGGKLAAINIFKILDCEDEEQIQTREKSRKLQQGYYRGDILIKNLTFKYPQRNTEIFKNFNMNIKGGSKLAIVGESGSGKSTILQLLLRFYEPQIGQILIDGINIKDFDIHYLRSLFGVVSQQPVLFYASFKQNIQYNKYDVSQQDIISATKSAQAYNFIRGEQKLENDEEDKQQSDTLLQKAFDRNVGLKGSHISGGQKQRVAIARVMLRKPKIVLLDEATSALDKTNQKLVQNALDRLMLNKTSITVAHRLDTIKNSDKIVVIKTGKIIEQGTFKQLMQVQGELYRLERGMSLNHIE